LKKFLFPSFIFLFVAAAFSELTPGTPAPEFPKDAIWLGTNGKKLSMAELKGRVVLVDIWEYTCINCIRTFPHFKEIYRKYHPAGLEIIGVHKGEFAFASDPANVERAYHRFQLPYPALVDIKDEVWKAYDCNSWPESFLIDREGVIRELHQGEGDYGKLEKNIQSLLREGHSELDFSKTPISPDHPIFGPACGEETEEIYVGTERGSSWGGKIANREGFQPDKTVSYAPTSKRVARGFFVAGRWKNRPDDFESVAASQPEKPVLLGITYQARDVYAVLDHAGAEPKQLLVTRDGKPIPPALRGKDVTVDDRGRTIVTIQEPRMYYLVTKEDDGKHELKFFPRAAGARICSFTFGNKCLQDFDRL